MNKEPYPLEELAEYEHQSWASWTKYLLDNLTEENIKRWKKQIEVPYSELSEKEKDSRRECAREGIDILGAK